MKNFAPFIFAAGLFASPSLYAACSVSLSHEQIMDCIVKQNEDCTQATESIQSRTTSKADNTTVNTQTADQIALKPTTALSSR